MVKRFKFTFLLTLALSIDFTQTIQKIESLKHGIGYCQIGYKPRAILISAPKHFLQFFFFKFKENGFAIGCCITNFTGK